MYIYKHIFQTYMHYDEKKKKRKKSWTSAQTQQPDPAAARVHAKLSGQKLKRPDRRLRVHGRFQIWHRPLEPPWHQRSRPPNHLGGSHIRRRPAFMAVSRFGTGHLSRLDTKDLTPNPSGGSQIQRRPGFIAPGSRQFFIFGICFQVWHRSQEPRLGCY